MSSVGFFKRFFICCGKKAEQKKPPVNLHVASPTATDAIELSSTAQKALKEQRAKSIQRQLTNKALKSDNKALATKLGNMDSKTFQETHDAYVRKQQLIKKAEEMGRPDLVLKVKSKSLKEIQANQAKAKASKTI